VCRGSLPVLLGAGVIPGDPGGALGGAEAWSGTPSPGAESAGGAGPIPGPGTEISRGPAVSRVMSPPAAVVASCVAPRAFLCVVAFLVAVIACQGPNVLGAGGAGVLQRLLLRLHQHPWGQPHLIDDAAGAGADFPKEFFANPPF
jgi:hypothetical protein